MRQETRIIDSSVRSRLYLSLFRRRFGTRARLSRGTGAVGWAPRYTARMTITMPCPMRALLCFAALALVLPAASVRAQADAPLDQGSGGGSDASALAGARIGGM